VGDVLVAQGNLPEALKSFQGSLSIRDRLAKADPNNAGWQRDLSVSYSKVGNVYRRQGDTAKAKDALNTGKAIMERMTKLSPDNATWKDDLAWFEGQIEALETQSARAAIEAAFEAGDLAKAAALQTDLAAAQEKAEIEKTGAAGAETAEQQGLVSWYRLFTREFGKALAAADRALKLAPDKLWIATNRAHALMFLGRAAEARAVYLGHRGHTVEGQGVWDEAILKDFAEFKKRGLTHPQMAEIKGLLAAK
jgi:tetratricopeptide (TPR) repeat protein